MDSKILALLVFLTSAYILVGALIFRALEGCHEKMLLQKFEDFKLTILENKTCVSEEELKAVIDEVVTSYQQGAISYRNNGNKTRWDFPGSVFFATTVVTTIGYGHLAPSTVGGRTFCVFYALIGIPLVLAMLSGIGDKLATLEQRLNVCMNRCSQHPRLGRIGRTLFIFLLGAAIFVFLPSVLFMFTEDWSYGESLYYSVITLTTIGFGDYVAAQNIEKLHERPMRLFISIWIFVGLAWLSLIISMAQDCVIKVKEKIPKRKSTCSNKNGKDQETRNGNADFDV